MDTLRKHIATISKKCFDAYGTYDGGFSFDHQISGISQVALDVRWKRIDPVNIGNNLKQASKMVFRFRCAGKNPFDVYDLVDFLANVLRKNGWTPSLPTGDTENPTVNKVEVDITAVLNGY